MAEESQGERMPGDIGSGVQPTGLAQLPHLTERELWVLLVAVESRQRQPIGGETGAILHSLHTAIAEAISVAQRETARLQDMVDD